MEPTPNAQKIAALNDQCRRNLSHYFLTEGVRALSPAKVAGLLALVATFRDFSAANDPYGERDFGGIEMDGMRFFWKIDYYDLAMERHSPDPADPVVTVRVLTVMRADEY